MRLELAAAVGVAARVIQRDATLPEVGRLIGSASPARRTPRRIPQAPGLEIGRLRDSSSACGLCAESSADASKRKAARSVNHRGSRAFIEDRDNQRIVIADVQHTVGDRRVGPHGCRKDLRPRDRLEPSGDAAARTISPFSRRISRRLPASVTLPAPNRSCSSGPCRSEIPRRGNSGRIPAGHESRRDVRRHRRSSRSDSRALRRTTTHRSASIHRTAARRRQARTRPTRRSVADDDRRRRIHRRRLSGPPRPLKPHLTGRGIESDKPVTRQKNGVAAAGDRGANARRIARAIVGGRPEHLPGLRVERDDAGVLAADVGDDPSVLDERRTGGAEEALRARRTGAWCPRSRSSFRSRDRRRGACPSAPNV